MDILENNWDNILLFDSSIVSFEFLEYFEHIFEPYVMKKYLNPMDRKEIILLLEESLKDECNLVGDCKQEYVHVFCHKLALNILDKYKNCPSKIPSYISKLKH
jgi:hypothetical protein